MTGAAAATIAAAAVAGLLVARPWQQGPDPTTPDGVSVRVGRTDSIGTVVEEGAEPVVRIEAKVDLVGPPGGTGRVRGVAGPGVMETRSSMPPLASGSSVVGLLTARVRCADVVGRDEVFTVTVDVTSGGRTGRVDAGLDRLGRPWRELLRRACGG